MPGYTMSGWVSQLNPDLEPAVPRSGFAQLPEPG